MKISSNYNISSNRGWIVLLLIILFVLGIFFVLDNTKLKIEVNRPSLSDIKSDGITEIKYITTITTTGSAKYPFEIYQVKIPSVNATCLLGGSFDSINTIDCKYDH